MSPSGAEHGRTKEQMASRAWLSRAIAAHAGMQGAGQCVGTTGVQASSGTFINDVCGEELRKRVENVTRGTSLETQVEVQPLDLDYRRPVGWGQRGHRLLHAQTLL